MGIKKYLYVVKFTTAVFGTVFMPACDRSAPTGQTTIAADGDSKLTENISPALSYGDEMPDRLFPDPNEAGSADGEKLMGLLDEIRAILPPDATLLNLSGIVLRPGGPSIDEINAARPMVLIAWSNFFDGNNVEQTIAANLYPYPGIDAFRKVCRTLDERDDVLGVYTQIEDLVICSDGAVSWPYADTVWIITSASLESLTNVAKPIGPFEIYEMSPDDFDEGTGEPNPAFFPAPGIRPVCLWWD